MSFLSLPWAALLAAALALPSVPPAPASIQAAPSDSSDVRLYVPNQLGASISVLDGAGRVLTTVNLTEHGFSPRALLHQVSPRLLPADRQGPPRRPPNVSQILRQGFCQGGRDVRESTGVPH